MVLRSAHRGRTIASNDAQTDAQPGRYRGGGLTTGFLVAGQVRAQLLTPSNRSRATRRSCAACRTSRQPTPMRAPGSRRCGPRSTPWIRGGQAFGCDPAAAQRGRGPARHAGLTAMHGPGIEVRLANGVPGPDSGGLSGYLVNYQDVQDVVNLLFAQGAKASRSTGGGSPR